MKAYSRVRSLLVAVLLALITIVSCLGFSACIFVNSGKLTNESGFIVEGGRFEKGSILEASLIDGESEEYSQVLATIEGERYDKTKPVYVFEISVKKDGVKVQPNGKVKVTVPISENVADYDALHIKDGGKIERLSVAYKNGNATFETGSFSKFALVKSVSSGGENSGNIDSSSGNGGDSSGGGEADTTTKYTFYSLARRIIPGFLNEGGTVRDTNDEDISYRELKLAEGTQYTVKSFCYPDYYFVGWYESSEREEATEDRLLSKEATYTFTVERNFTICALYAYKTDFVGLRLNATSAGFSCINKEPITTLVTKDSSDVPDLEGVYVIGLQANGEQEEYSYSRLSDVIEVDDGGLDFGKVGKYTITYAYKKNPNVKATLDVEVVESGHTLHVSTSGNYLKFRYGIGDTINDIEAVLPKGRLVTLTAEAKNGYAFVGWYDEKNVLVSKDLVYCFEMPDNDVRLHGKYEASSLSLSFTVWYSYGELVDGFGNSYIWGGTEKKYFKVGETVSFTVREYNAYQFEGWYDVTGGKSELITKDKTVNITLNESKEIEAKFNEKVRYIEIDSTTLEDEGFVNGRVAFAIGDTAIEYKNFAVIAKGFAGSYRTLSADEYTIDDSAVNFNAQGTYTITYIYKQDPSIKTEVEIVVVDSQNAKFEFEQHRSYLDHEYDGKATFISLYDVKVNGSYLYEFRSDSKIWEKISYKWIDKSTNKEVDTDDVDVTINGEVVKNFGPENDKITIGNELGGPIKAGSYRFELIYDGTTALTKDSTISTRVYKKITTKEEFKTNEGSTWVNFELYYYTIIGYADGKYYAMQIPTIGYGDYEAEAREVSFDANGNAIMGEGNDFAFVNVRYSTSDYSGYTEFLTGYYGSYVVCSSSNTIDGTLFGIPYIYRTGYTSVSGGKIYREYGNKEHYGMRTEFDENGAVTIHSRYYGETANNRLRLVKDGDKYVFTSVAADADTRESFDVFIYQSIIKTDVQESDK